MLGEKIKYLRAKEGITQEAFAEKLNVSRSAIAKWETDNGTPDINNLKMISQMFAISIDELLNESDQVEGDSLSAVKCDCTEYNGYYCDIELKGWNDGAYHVLIIGEDKDFIFYKMKEESFRFCKKKENSRYGLIGKKYIISITRGSKCEVSSESFEFVDRNYFCMKHVSLELAKNEGIIKGFFDFRNDNYRDVIIHSFTETMVGLKLGGEFNVDAISKIEALEE